VDGGEEEQVMSPHVVAPVTVMLLIMATSASADPGSSCAEETPDLLPSIPYSAIRRLEAENKKTGRQGWMEVRTTFDRDGILTITVLSEGGSEQIRNKVLRAALQAEQDAVKRRRGTSAAAADNKE
jgi:hypothetical protein